MIFDSVHNYYEVLLKEYLMRTLAKEADVDQDFLEDVACLALNQLPVRYIRHDVDMAFFLSVRDREKMQQKISEAVLSATASIREKRAADMKD